MKFFKLYSNLLVMIVLSSCMNELENDVKNQYTLVYLDFSLSHDSITRNNMLENLVEIYRGQPEDIDCRFYVKLIENGVGREELFDYTIHAIPDDAIRQEKLDRYNLLEDGAKMLRDNFNNFFRTIPNTENCKSESCICNSLENAHSILKTEHYDKVQLIVLSDMLEDCSNENTSQKHSVDLCDIGNYNRSFNKILRDIENDYEPKYHLRDYVLPENLYFIHGGISYANQNNCLKDNELEEVWKAYLKKMGYTDEDFESSAGITFSPNIPQCLKLGN